MTATTFHHHVLVLLQNDIGTLVEVEDGNAAELGWRAARLGHVEGGHEVDEGLHNGVVGGIHVGVEGEGALAVAVEGGVPVRGNNPVLPPQVPEYRNSLKGQSHEIFVVGFFLPQTAPPGPIRDGQGPF